MIKNKPIQINIDSFSKKGKPLNVSQIERIQKAAVDKMIREGVNALEIKDFVRKSTLLKRSAGKKLTQKTYDKTIDLLNKFETDRTTGKNILEIKKPKLTQYTKFSGEKEFDMSVEKYLSKKGLLSKSAKKLIRQRRERKQKLIDVRGNANYTKVKEIIQSMSRLDIYKDDIIRLLNDYLGLTFPDEDEMMDFIRTM